MKQESGFTGVLYTLGGIKITNNRGRTSTRISGTLSSTTPVQIAADNQNRLSAIISNTGLVLIYIILGEAASGTIDSMVIPLDSGQACQIDALVPWSGSIWAALAAAGSCTYDGGEISAP